MTRDVLERIAELKAKARKDCFSQFGPSSVDMIELVSLLEAENKRLQDREGGGAMTPKDLRRFEHQCVNTFADVKKLELVGWELVAVLSEDLDGNLTYFLKRPVE